MDWKRTAAGLIGFAFIAQAFRSTLPWWVRLGYLLVGAHEVQGALGIGETVAAPLLNGAVKGVPVRTPRALGAAPVDPTTDAKQKAQKLNFAFGKVGSIDERVARIHEQMLKGVKDPSIYALARSVLSRKCGDDWCIPEKDNKKEIEALFHEVRSRVRYTWDPSTYDAFQTPQKTLELASGDCDDFVALLGALLMSVGYKVRSRIVHTKGFPTWNHIYLVVQLTETNGESHWWPLDATVNKPPGWEVPGNLMVKPPKDYAVVENG